MINLEFQTNLYMNEFNLDIRRYTLMFIFHIVPFYSEHFNLLDERKINSFYKNLYNLYHIFFCFKMLYLLMRFFY